MKKLLNCMFAAAVAALLGCHDANTTSGGPGAPAANQNRPSVTQADNSFELKAPLLETTVKQGQSKTVTFGISRGKNFAQDVKVEFQDPPKGIKITPASGDFKAGMNELQVTIDAAPDAALGHHTINVIGTPATGAKATTTLKIEVAKP